VNEIDRFFAEAEELMKLADLGLLEDDAASAKVAHKIAVELVKLRRSYVGLTNIVAHLIIRQQVIEELSGLDSATIDSAVSAISSEVETLEKFKAARTLKALHERHATGVQTVPPVR
jgi:hypothetical protein